MIREKQWTHLTKDVIISLKGASIYFIVKGRESLFYKFTIPLKAKEAFNMLVYLLEAAVYE